VNRIHEAISTGIEDERRALPRVAYAQEERGRYAQEVYLSPAARVKLIVFKSHTEPVELLLAIACLMWGLYILTDGSMPAADYRIYLLVASKPVWIFCFFVAGVWSFWQITHPVSKNAHVACNFFLMAIWTITAFAGLVDRGAMDATLVASIAGFWLVLRSERRG